MQAGKSLSAGEGGVFCTDNREFYEKALLLGHFGRLENVNQKNKKFATTGFGFKYRPHPMAIALALSQLKRLEKQIKIRNMNCEYLEAQLRKVPGITIIEKPNYCNHRSYYGFRFLYDENKTFLSKKGFIQKLHSGGIPIEDENYRLLHNEPIFLDKNLFPQVKDKKKLPITERVHKNIVNLSLPYKFDQRLMDNYVSVIRDVIEKCSVLTRLKQGEPASKKPSHLTLELTMGCNMECKACYQRKYRKNHNKNRELTVVQIERLLKKIHPKSMMLSGGEPTTRKDFFEILDLLSKHNIRSLILTNGINFDEDFTYKMEKYQGKTNINFSFNYNQKDSINKKEKVLNSRLKKVIHRLNEHFNIGIATVVLEDNISDIKSIIEIFSKKNIYITIMPDEFYTTKEIGDTKKRLGKVFNKKPEDLSLIYIENNEDSKQIKKKETNLDLIREVMRKAGNASFLPTYLNHENRGFYTDQKIRGICKNLIRPNLRIDSKGNVIICRLIREKVGDINKDSIENIMNNEKYKRFRIDYMKNGPFPICKRCAHFISEDLIIESMKQEF